ncbi:septum formation family protein [Herbiconiux solani]|uniref:septum formation family protein n=1 Tax=Herbiconiux solani TaxID=661329 RepID=UPI0012EE156F|nr:septum formation family protein [Herbiconiux solani]
MADAAGGSGGGVVPGPGAAGGGADSGAGAGPGAGGRGADGASGAAARERSKPRALVIAAAAVGLAVVVALFFIGMRIGQGGVTGRSLVSTAPTATASESAVPTATPTLTPAPAASASPTPAAGATGAAASTGADAVPAGPAAPGVHEWDELGGGECFTGFTSPWEQRFTVVDCASAHTAQLVSTGLFAEDAAAAYPGEAELVSRLNLLCTAPTALAYDAAGALPDVQWQASYPADAAAWSAGDRRYSCFFSRTSGEPLGGSLVAAG